MPGEIRTSDNLQLTCMLCDRIALHAPEANKHYVLLCDEHFQEWNNCRAMYRNLPLINRDTRQEQTK